MMASQLALASVRLLVASSPLMPVALLLKDWTHQAFLSAGEFQPEELRYSLRSMQPTRQKTAACRVGNTCLS
jgi:hypothetical protein